MKSRTRYKTASVSSKGSKPKSVPELPPPTTEKENPMWSRRRVLGSLVGLLPGIFAVPGLVGAVIEDSSTIYQKCLCGKIGLVEAGRDIPSGWKKFTWCAPGKPKVADHSTYYCDTCTVEIGPVEYAQQKKIHFFKHKHC